MLEPDPQWYKKAVLYELYVRSFYDSNGDGYGDFRGMTEKLDYLEWLGIDCIWLLPFYQSPLRDGGYDISDFYSILPEYGNLNDFMEFMDTAHSKGMRVVADFVVNHTSNEHPWFQESRKPGSAKRDWYVWSDTLKKYEEARIIFIDTEQSNWTWDDEGTLITGTVSSAISRTSTTTTKRFKKTCWPPCASGSTSDSMVSAWMRVPYLYEREGTNCENLPETHRFLKRIRAEVDKGYEDKVILAEANQWPQDVVPYFGDGDECHMAFHFPLMPRMFMAARRQVRYPVVEILEQIPEIPELAQWGIFLRNHDELTLEMVTDEERDYMYNEYAKDPRMKLNLGIRRRLAPLLENNRDQIELFHAMLFSLPGTPIVYYGDELRMGDNIYLGDRDGVRTPMQWTSDRNAGFSRADFAQLYLPVLLDPVYGYQSINVEAQLRSQHSFLQWFRRMLAIRKQHPLFGTGSFEVLHPDNPAIFAYIREQGEDIIVCVNNLSPRAQAVELDLSGYEGKYPIEMLGRERFPRIGELPYLLTLGPHDFYWFQLVAEEGS